MALAFMTPTWPTATWVAAMRQVAPALDVRAWPDAMGAVADIDYAAVWLPPANALRGLPNLKIIFSLGAGVDAILRDTTLPPDIPLVRVNVPDLTHRMSEYIVLHVLLHQRQQRRLDDNQRQQIWHSFDTAPAAAFSVGIMGMGVMGQDAARKLAMMGFRVAGWSQSHKVLDGIESFAGLAEFDAFLAQSDILVSLLPATPQTHGIINRQTIEKLSRRGPFGAPILINAGRGAQQVAGDILHCLDAGTLYAATLDVFAVEPLPADDPLWAHPRVTITPHCAADSEPASICAYIARQIKNFEAGQPLANLVDRARGY